MHNDDAFFLWAGACLCSDAQAILTQCGPAATADRCFTKELFNIGTQYIKGVRSRDQRPYWFFETKGIFCIKIEFNSQKTGLLLQHGRRDIK